MSYRRPNEFLHDKITVDDRLVAAASATETLFLQTMDGAYVINKFEIEAPGGLAADATNYWVITLQAGSTVLATWSTLTGANGALTDATFMSAPLATVHTGAAGDVLQVVLTKHASASNLPIATRFVVHAHQL